MTKFCLWVDVQDLITCATFGDDWIRGLQMVEFPVSPLTCVVALTTLALPRECVITHSQYIPENVNFKRKSTMVIITTNPKPGKSRRPMPWIKHKVITSPKCSNTHLGPPKLEPPPLQVRGHYHVHAQYSPQENINYEDTSTWLQWPANNFFFFSGLNHYKCVAPPVANSLQSGRFWARSTASVHDSPWESRSFCTVFIQVIRGRPGGLFQYNEGEEVTICFDTPVKTRGHFYQKTWTIPMWENSENTNQSNPLLRNH